MTAAITRSRRAAIAREAALIRRRCQRTGFTAEHIAAAIREELAEVTELEAWRLALGWSRADTIAQIGELYVADGLLPPGLSESMLCRWEHDPEDWPGQDYAVMLCRAYRATPEQLGLHKVARVRQLSAWTAELIGYGRNDAGVAASGRQEGADPMTTDAGLPSVRESLQLALLAEPEGSPLVDELAEAAADHYHLNYSKHPVPVLFREVRAARTLLAGVLPADTGGTELHRQLGRLSGLLGNLAFHLDDPAGARTHLGTAVSYANRCGDTALAAWAYGAQSMVARHTGNLTAAYTYAERGVAAAPAGLVRAQLHAWALLPTLAQQGRDREAAAALDVALTELEADPAGQAPGRFGFDEPELALHQAEAHLTLGRTEEARTRAEASAAACITGTPGWAAATLVLAQAEASETPSDAAQRALDVLDRVPPSRLRATARTRLERLNGLLSARPAEYVADLRERLRTLPPPVDASGAASA
ncbi:Twin-arginine translocation pathway signal [Streptomyces sp. NBC_01549]|uniref:Twin-arginine translocation pathway signal n=1 Tax=Streptomyces sp. NBC_01549 TaxID=2975874 RepID=UPI00224D6B79|nr:Twin-arginine translocation pathway signal [Streptomyces sp. NBC_01549]MCX4598392.1 Twin-arginine translocation pathway signal [Streptomyces sp. NBC_01549]